jgi:hypothetical protein
MNYRAFLNEHNGNPNKKNNSNETALHAVCSLSPQSPYSAQERRAACVTILLNIIKLARGIIIILKERENTTECSK